MVFYPADRPVPNGLIGDEFLLRPLLSSDVELDYEALMVSNEMLRRWEGGTWPADDFTPAENLIDLARHELEHTKGLAYTFTMMDPGQERCLGCVYIDPLINLLKSGVNVDGETLAAVGDFEAVVRFWVIQPRLANDLDRRLLKALIQWFEDEWSFSRVYYRVNEQDVRQRGLLLEAGYICRFTVDVPGINGRYLIFGRP